MMVLIVHVEILSRFSPLHCCLNTGEHVCRTEPQCSGASGLGGGERGGVLSGPAGTGEGA